MILLPIENKEKVLQPLGRGMVSLIEGGYLHPEVPPDKTNYQLLGHSSDETTN
jgi:hypothetical protein